MKKNKSTIFPGLIMIALFVVFTVLVKVLDVQPVGPDYSEIGFAGINLFFKEAIGIHMFWYKLTEGYGYLSILIMFLMALTGLIQLIKRKSIIKVDKELFVLAGFYAIVLGLYVIFEKVIINYRPVILDEAEGLEASYPSSHTMLIVFVMGSTAALLNVIFGEEKKSLVRAAVLVCDIILVTGVLGRLISGVHWFTDIFAGLVLSLGLVMLFRGILDAMSAKKAQETV